jgi:AcrR family transcriptional regulator
MSDQTVSLRRGEATRRRIVEAALQEAAQRGLGMLSLGDLAQRAGLSRSGVVKHFQRKGSLELAVVEEATRRFAEVVRSPADRLPPGRRRLQGVFDGRLRWQDEV